MERTREGGEEHLGMHRETLGVDGDDGRERGTSGPVPCGQRTGRVAVNAFGVSSHRLTPDQGEEVAVKKNLL